MDWVDETCRLIDELGEIGVDPGSSAFSDCCYNNPHMIRLRSCLQRSKSVYHLTLRNMVVGSRGGAWLEAVLRDSPGLSSLYLEDTYTTTRNEGEEHDDLDTSDGNAVIQGIARGLEYNRFVERLHLKANRITDATSLGDMLSKNNALLELRLCHNRLDHKASVALCNGLKDNMTLRILDLTGNGMDDNCINEVSRGLCRHSSVQFLCLDFNTFTSRGVAAIATMLQNNSILRELHLFGNHIDAEGARFLAQGLTKNCRLSCLILSFNNIGSTGAAYLAEALVVNKSLSKLWLPANQLGNAGIIAFAERLPQMLGLTHLNLGDYFDNEAAAAVVQTIRFNTQLRVLYMESVLYDDERIEMEIDFYLRLNRSGRKVLSYSYDHQRSSNGDGDYVRAFPVALWPRVLVRADYVGARSDCTGSTSCAPDVLFYLLREKPELFSWIK